MARSFIYDRPLDARILPDSGNSEHEFRFNTLLEIKKEVDDTVSEIGTESFDEGLPASSIDNCVEQYDELRSANETNEIFRRKLVSRFSELQRRSNGRESNDQSPIAGKPRENRRSGSKTTVAEENRVTRSSLLAQKSLDRCKEQNSKSKSVQEEAVLGKREKRNIRTTRLTTQWIENFYTCQVCGLSYRNQRQLRAHVGYYSGNGEYHCGVCNMKFTRSFVLSCHVKNAHSAIGNKDNHKFECPLCKETFEKKRSLIAHVLHLHNKKIVSSKRKINADKELVALSDGSNRITRKKASAKKSESIEKHTVLRSSFNNKGIATKDNSDSHLSVDNLHNGEADVPNHKKVQTAQTDECLANQNQHLEVTANEASKNSPQNPTNTLNTVLHENGEATTGNQIQSPIDESAEKTMAPRNCQQIIGQRTFSSKLQYSRAARKKRQQRRRRRANSKIVPRNIQPKQGNLVVNNSTNSADNQSAPEAVDQSDNSAKAHADQNQEMEIADAPRRTRSSTLQILTLRNSMTTAPHPDRNLLPDEKSCTEGRSSNGAVDDDKLSMIGSDLQSVAADQIRLPQPQQPSNEQVRSVLLHRVPEVTDNNVDGQGFAVVERNNANVEVIYSDDFVDPCETTVVNCIKNERMNGVSCESISQGTVASCSNISLQDSFHIESDTAMPLSACDTTTDIEMKDVKVLLVRLGNRSDLSTTTSSPKSSSPPNSSVVKIENPYSDSDNQQFSNELTSWEEPALKYNSKEAAPSMAMKLRLRPKRVINIPQPTTISRKKRVRSRVKSTRVYRCRLCDEVLVHNFLAASHYLSRHIENGVLQCCLCHVRFKTLKALRLHLIRNYTNNSCMNSYKKKRISKSRRRSSQYLYELENQAYNLRRMQQRTVNMLEPKISVVENTQVTLPEMSPVPTSMKETQRIDPVSAEKDREIIPLRIRENIDKRLKCAICNRVFFNNSRFKHHMLAAHADVKYSHSIKGSKRQSLANRKSCDSRQELQKCPKKDLAIKKKNLHLGHDKSCRKKLYLTRELRSSQIDEAKKASVRQHSISGGGRKKLENHKCEICRLSCCCLTSLKLHKTRYSAHTNHVCGVCGLSFSREHVLARHKKTAHNENDSFHGKLKCEICNQCFYKKKFLKIHLAHFHSLKYFQCTVCKMRFNSYRSLNNHKLYYSVNLNSVCATCGESFKCKSTLEYHRSQVHNHEKIKAYKYFCDECSCAFNDEMFLRAHVAHVHKSDGQAERTVINDAAVKSLRDNNNEENGNVCIETDVRTDNLTVREDEISEDGSNDTIASHTSSDYKCGICKLSFTDPYAILNHEWEYSNEGEYTCDFCNRKFETNTLLKKHRIKHYQRNVVRKIECYICKENFSQLEDLKMHGLHLHGPTFLWGENSETDCHQSQNISDSRIKCQRDEAKKRTSGNDTCDTIGLVASDEINQNGRILLFQKTPICMSSVVLRRRHSNESAYCCDFCKTNFSSASLLRDHSKKHAYRAYYANSSKYLCLICKNKFRTNDVLRAHVIHCHTSVENKYKISESESPKDYLLDGSSKVQHYSSNESQSISTGNSCVDAPLIPLSQSRNQSSQSKNVSPREENRSSNFANDMTDEDSTSMPSRVTCGVRNDTQCSDLDAVDDGSGLESLEPGITGHVNCDPAEEAVESFTTKLKDSRRFENHSRTISKRERDTKSRESSPCKCEICDKSFTKFGAMLKHWDSCIETSRLKCDLEKASRVIRDSLNKHKIPCVKEKNCNVVQSSSAIQLNDDKTLQTPVCSDILKNKPLGEEKTMDNSFGTVNPSNDTSQQPASPKIGAVTVRSFANIVIKKLKNNGDVNKRQVDETHDTSPKITLEVERRSEHGIKVLKPRIVSRKLIPKQLLANMGKTTSLVKNGITGTPIAIVQGPAESIPQLSQSDVRVLNIVQCDANGKPLPCHSPVQDSNNVVSNVLNRKSQKHGEEVKIPKELQSTSSSSVESSGFVPITKRDCIGVNQTNVASKHSGTKCGSMIDDQIDRTRTSLPSLSSATESSAYYLCIQPTVSKNPTSLPSGSSQRRELNYSNEKTLSNYVPIPPNPSVRPPIYLRLQPTSANSFKISNQAVSLDNSNSDSHSSNPIPKNLPTLLKKRLGISINPNNPPDNQRTSNNSSNNCSRDVVSNLSSSVVNLNRGNDSRAPILASSVGSTTGNVLPKLLRITKPVDPVNRNASSKESTIDNRCGFCNQIFADRMTLMRHVALHKTENQCPACGLTFSNASALQQHIPEHKVSKCSNCNRISFFSDSVDYPIGTRKFCSGCNTLLPLPTRRLNLLVTNCMNRVVKCGICKDTFGTISEMTVHFKLIHSSFVCGVCELRFTTKFNLHSHMMTHDSNSREISQCETCKNYYMNKSDLAAHAVSHQVASAVK